VAPKLVSRGSVPALAPARYLLGDRAGAVTLLVVASTIGGFCEAAILAIIAEAAGALVTGTHTVRAAAGPLSATVSISTLLLIAFALAVARLALQAPLSQLPSRIASDVQAALQRELFDAFTQASWSEQSRDREGHLQELMTNQIFQGAIGVLAATSLVTALLTLIVLIATALVVNPVAAIAVLGTAVLVFGMLRPLNRVITRWSGGLSQSQMEFAGGVGQATRLAEETHVFGVAGAQRERMSVLIENSRGFFYRVQLLGRLTTSVYQSCIYLLVVGLLAVLAAANAGHVAALGAVVLLLIRAGGYGQAVQGSYQALRQASPFIERVRGVSERYRASTPVRGERRISHIETIAFEHVSFAYTPERPVLRDLSFAVEGGEAIGIVGPSGAGKSTLMQIILQLRKPDSGLYLVNGAPAAEITSGDWHDRVAYVPQEPRLLHASVADNIRFFRDLDDAAVERAARLARIDTDIASWPDGYQTLIGPRADAVSGGQQQRICIARALAGEPAMLVLDEPTSSLDPRSESLLQESLRTLKAQVTLFVIAHRMSTLDICSRVMVVIDGHVDAFDTAARLKLQDGYYRAALGLAAEPATSTVAPV
jgi:ATP-binding cassette subfamily B protein